MSEIKKLIERLCPDGVEYKKLGDIADITIGEFVHKNKQNPNGKYPVYNGGSSFTGYYDNYNRTGNKIVVSARGAYAGFVNKVYGCYWAGNSSYSIDIISPEVSWHFVYYYLKLKQTFMISKQQKGGGVPAISKKQMQDFEIPVPPIEVQSKIVEILDNFTELEAQLEAQLEAELEARRKQYEYYRNQLLTFDKDKGARFERLKDVFEMRNGYTPSKNNSSFWDNGIIPWFRMEDIRENGRLLSDSIQHIAPSAIKGKGLFKANSIILATSATIGEHALISVEHLSNQRFTNIYPKENFLEIIDMKFIFYYMFIIDEWCKQHTQQGSFASVDMNGLYNLLVPIPPLEEQKRIVSILDRFEALTTDLQSGLPAEIEARRKQYEYYREKLLTFKRKSA